MGTEDCARCGRQVDLLHQTLADGVGGTVAVATRWCNVLVGLQFSDFDQNTEIPIRSRFCISAGEVKWQVRRC